MIYLDSSAIVKRYVKEPGSDVVCRVYEKALRGEVLLSFSVWNVGEVLGVLDKYRRRGWLGDGDYLKARLQFLGETLRLLRLKILKVMPVKTSLLTRTWSLVEKHHIYEADALQILSAKLVKAEKLYTGDQLLHEVALREGVKSEYVG